jgi:hypothetical protein
MLMGTVSTTATEEATREWLESDPFHRVPHLARQSHSLEPSPNVEDVVDDETRDWLSAVEFPSSAWLCSRNASRMTKGFKTKLTGPRPRAGTPEAARKNDLDDHESEFSMASIEIIHYQAVGCIAETGI